MAEYIDREAGVTAIEAHLHRQDPDDRNIYPLEEWQREQNWAYDNAMEILENLPAADVKPVEEAMWIWDDEGYHCSKCFFHAYGCTGEILSGDFLYCPHCGADMVYELSGS